MKVKNWEAILGDCLEELKDIESETVDMIITSPPYDNLRTYNGNLQWDFEKIAGELECVLKDWGVLVWIVWDSTVKWSETLSSFRQALYFQSLWLNVHDTMIWRKPHFANPSNNRYHQTFEYMFVFSKWKPKTFNPIKDLPIKYGKPVGKTSTRHKDWTITNKEFTGKINEFSSRHNVWDCITSGQENFWKKIEHPATFPVRLVRDHILSWSNEWDTILDPFAGSFTTAVACENTNRKWICMERDEVYFKIWIDRIKKDN